jgi:hypothetical protein
VSLRKHIIYERVGIAVIILAAIMVAFWGGSQWYEATKWNPLAQYPIQVVSNDKKVNAEHLVTENDNAYSQSPSFYWDQEIHSSGIKCVKADEGVVDIQGILYWVSDDPPGRLIEAGRGANKRGPGCQQYEFSNPIPDIILAEMQKLKDRGMKSSVWHLSGTETPIRGDEEGESRTWQTTTFKVIHQDAP